MKLRTILAASMLACSCTAHRTDGFDPGRPATGVPDHFVALSASEASAEAPPDACRSPLVDPRNDARIRLVRSSGGRGDYEVSPGQYGVGKDEVLRIECLTGRVIGIVARTD